MEHGRQSGRNMLFAPEDEAIVEPKLKHTDSRESVPTRRASVATVRLAPQHKQRQDQRRQDKSNTGKRKRRQIGEADLYEQPGRSPDAT